MKKILSMLFALGILSTVYVLLSAQPDPVSDFTPKKEAAAQEAPLDESAEQPAEEATPAPAKKKPAKAAKKAEEGPAEAAPSESAETDTVTNNFKGRIGQLKRFHAEQETFGKKFALDWDEFWKKLFDRCQNFEKNMAKQRLNHFELLHSLSKANQAQATADFERQQGNLTKAFEQEQREDIDKFFAQLDSRLKRFSAEQDKQRLEFLSQSLPPGVKLHPRGKAPSGEKEKKADKEEQTEQTGQGEKTEAAKALEKKKTKGRWFGAPTREPAE
jgi:hypothetical protein